MNRAAHVVGRDRLGEFGQWRSAERFTRRTGGREQDRQVGIDMRSRHRAVAQVVEEPFAVLVVADGWIRPRHECRVHDGCQFNGSAPRDAGARVSVGQQHIGQSATFRDRQRAAGDEQQIDATVAAQPATSGGAIEVEASNRPRSQVIAEFEDPVDDGTHIRQNVRADLIRQGKYRPARWPADPACRSQCFDHDHAWVVVPQLGSDRASSPGGSGRLLRADCLAPPQVVPSRRPCCAVRRRPRSGILPPRCRSVGL